MKNVLVTGGAGFIGSNFVRYTLGFDATLRAIDYDILDELLPDSKYRPHRQLIHAGRILNWLLKNHAHR